MGDWTKWISGERLILTPPDVGAPLRYTLVLTFNVTNNESEYEALMISLRLAKGIDIASLYVYCDSQLVVNQVKGQYAAKGEKLKRYMKEANVRLRLKNIWAHAPSQGTPAKGRAINPNAPYSEHGSPYREQDDIRYIECQGTNEHLQPTIRRPSDPLQPFIGWQGQV